MSGEKHLLHFTSQLLVNHFTQLLVYQSIRQFVNTVAKDIA